MKKNKLNKLFSVLTVLALVLTAVLGTLVACKGHECNHVCPDCNKCTDADCADPKCEEKCAGHEHVCNHICSECGKCTDAECIDPICVDKCKGHVPARVYYVSADAQAGDAEGTKENPYNIYTLLNDFNLESIRKLNPGDVVYVMPGYYKLSNRIIISASGLFNKNIKIINAAYDSNSGYDGKDTRAVIDFSAMAFDSTSRGVSLYGNYIYWYGIDVCGAGDNGLYIAGSYNTVEYCEFYNNRDTGLQIGREASAQLTVNEWPSYNLIKNCTSHNNYDNETYGENADGFAAKLTVGYGNVFDGCIAYRNSDDGWDLYAKSESGNIGAVIMYNCVAFENGYLEYTQQEFHKLFPKWNDAYSEPNTNSYTTRDGDGNGFKLGGSIMEGDVVLYNCLSYGNKMHGVTDNSNPGVINLTGVTSYNNGAAVDNNPASEHFGQIKDIANDDTYGNIDLGRQTYSYNNIDKVLSVKDDMAKSIQKDEYRGAANDSILLGASKANVISGSIDADTVNGGKTHTSQINNLVASDIFETLPVVKTVDGAATTYTYNLSGLKDLGAYGDDGLVLNANRAHIKYRNADNSVNMGGILAVKDYSKLLGGDKKIGSVLNLTSYGAYTHFADANLVGNAESEIASILAKSKESLTIGLDLNACYQDFDILTKMKDCFISWSSSNEKLIKLNEQLDVSVSKTEYVRAEVTRPTDNDTKVTLTATISYLNQHVTRDFEIVVKKDAPAIGKIYVSVAETGESINDGGRLIIDINRQYAEPSIRVENGAYYNGKLLSDSQYSVKTTYKYAAIDSADDKDFVEINGYTPNVAGVYKITHNVTLTDGSNASKSYTYKVYVASTSAQVDFLAGATLTVNRDGYIVSGALNSVTGTLYAVSSSTQKTDLTVENIKTADGVKSYDFRDTSVSFQFENDNSGAYYVYYALANANGDMTSQLYESQVKVVNISTHADFNKMAGGGVISGENPSETIYLLTKCLDFTGKTYTPGSSPFRGLFNGQGHTISGITVKVASDAKASVFYKVTGGTIENVKFDNIVLEAGSNKTAGIIGEARGGYFNNIAVTNVGVSGAQRMGGLIGHVFDGAIPTYVNQVSVINPLPRVNSAGQVIADADGNPIEPTYDWKYSIQSSTDRAAGIIGFIQPSGSIQNDVKVYITNCYSQTYVHCGGYGTSGIVGEYDDDKSGKVDYEFRLEIRDCLNNSTLVNTGKGQMGGILGYQKGNGSLRISGCVSMGRLFYKSEEVLACQKNASGIMGKYNLYADAIVTNCYATMEEHNSNFSVQAESRAYYNRKDVYDSYLEWDLENIWTFTTGQGVTLNFLGSWTCACSEAE